MKVERLNSGLIIPAQPKEKRKIDNILEIDDPNERHEANQLLGDLYRMFYHGGEIILPEDVDINKARCKLIHSLAEVLLGNEWDCEVPC